MERVAKAIALVIVSALLLCCPPNLLLDTIKQAVAEKNARASMVVTLGLQEIAPDGSVAFGGIFVNAVKTLVLIVENRGTGTLRLTGSPRVELSGSTKFSLLSMPPSTIEPGESSIMAVEFRPAGASGAFAATATIVTNDPEHPSFKLSLQGNGLSNAPQLVVTQGGTAVADASEVEFGTATVGNSKSLLFSIQNAGTTSLHLSGGPVDVLGTDQALFPIDSQPVATVAPGGSVSFTLRFSPNAMGRVSATVSIPNDDTVSGDFSFQVSGTGGNLPVAADPEFSPPGGTYTSAIQVSLSTATAEAAILYTTDGSIPSATNGASCTYTAPISIAATATIKAIATASDMDDSAVATAVYTITGKVANPGFSPPGGTYASAQSVALATATPGASIRYTIDSTTPSSTYGTVYTLPIAVASSLTLKAIACRPGWDDSSVVSAAYTINGPTAMPSFSPVPGTYAGTQSVTITSATAGASIWYTTSGVDPASGSGTLYETPVSISSTTTLKAIACRTGHEDSAVATGVYTILEPAAAPGFSPGAGTYHAVQSVTISSSTPGASIRYTTDGSQPTSSVGCPYTGPVSVTATTTIKAIAYKAGYLDSSVSSAAFTLSAEAPAFNPGEGGYPISNPPSVSITCPTPGVSIRYTIDGSTPTSSYGTSYTGPIAVSSTTTLKAVAFRSGWSDSPVSTAVYTITGTCANPSFDPNGGTYTSAQMVTIGCSTPGASIRFTTDGSTPSSTYGTPYSAPISVPGNLTIKAIAYQPGLADSAVVTATYTIKCVDPLISPGTGTYTNDQQVTLSCTTPGTTIKYTLNDPTPPSPTYGSVYSGPLTINGAALMKAIAYKDGWTPSGVVSASYTMSTLAPAFSPDAGHYSGSQSVTISSGTSGSLIHYTTDGSTPTSSNGTPYSGPVSVTGSLTLKAIAYRTGYSDSSVSSATYTLPCAVVVASPAGGTYNNDQSVSLSCATSGAIIRYTWNDPTPPSATYGTIYSSPLNVTGNLQLGVIAYKDGWDPSTVGYPTYLMNTLAPAFNPPGGSYASGQSVTISNATSGSSIRYTTNGSTPTSSDGTVYTAPVSVSASLTLKAIAYRTNYNDSGVSSATYTLPCATPGFAPGSGTYNNNQSVTISCSTPGVTIRYTTDGSTPSQSNGTVYGAPVSVSASQTLKAIAYRGGWSDSSVGSAVYSMATLAPSISPAAGTYGAPQTITLSSSTSGSNIRYTTDGTDPTSGSGTLYAGAFTLAGNTKLKAIAYKTGYADSTVSSNEYRIYQTIDSAGTVGSMCSLAVSGSSCYISYYDGSNGYLKFAKSTNGGASWATSTIDTLGGKGTSIEVSGSTIYISYPGRTSGLRFAKSTDGGDTWSTSVASSDTVGEPHTSLAISGSWIYISYYDSATTALKVAVSSNGGSSWTLKTPDSAGTVGQYSDIAAVGNSVFVSYFDATNGDLKMASSLDNGSAWPSKQTVVSSGVVGKHTCLITQDGSFIGIGYASDTAATLCFVKSTDGGATWATPVTVDSAGGTYASGTLGDSGTAYLSYYCAASIKIAVTTNSGDTWTKYVTDSAAAVYTSIRYSGGTVCVSYQGTDADLKFFQALDHKTW